MEDRNDYRQSSKALDITDEVEQETGSAGPNYTNQDGGAEQMVSDTDTTQQSIDGPDPEWYELERRRSSLDFAIKASGPHAKPEEIVATATTFTKFLKGE